MTTQRLAGPDRYATAAAIFDATFGARTEPTVAVVAPGSNFPDALSGINLLGRKQYLRGTGGVLLTPFADLPSPTRDVLRRTNGGMVHVQGDTQVVSTRAEQQVRDLGLPVERNGGRDRYWTAAGAFFRGYQPEYVNAFVTKVDGKNTALLVSGADYADAMSAGPLSYREQLPLLLSDPQRLPDATRRALTNDRIYQQIYVVGGESAVSQKVVAELEAMGLTVQRIAGPNWQATAVALFDFAAEKFGWQATHVNLARGDDYPDALAGGPHGGEEQAPILLTANGDELSAVTREFLRAHSDTISSIDVFGDDSAVSDAVVEDARRAAMSP